MRAVAAHAGQVAAHAGPVVSHVEPAAAVSLKSSSDEDEEDEDEDEEDEEVSVAQCCPHGVLTHSGHVCLLCVAQNASRRK